METTTWLIANLAAAAGYLVWGLGLARRNALPGLTALILIVPLWTTIGVFFVLQWRAQSDVGAYALLERQTFPIVLDAAYVETLAMYWLFSYAFLGILTLIPPIGRNTWQARGALLELVPYFPMGITALLAGVGLAVQEVLTRGLMGGLATQSLYAAAGNPLVAGVGLKVLVYAVLATSALAALGASMLLIGRSYGHRYRMLTWISFGLILLLQLRSNLITGDRSATLLLALGLAASVLTFARRGQVSGGAKLLATVVFGALAYFTIIIGMARANSMGTRAVQSPVDFVTRPGEVWSYFISNALEGEATSAHTSLYLLLQRGVEPFQVIPFFGQSYGPYSTQVGLPPEQGFTIHPVAAWWMSVGPLAPVAAAAYLGLMVLLFRWVATRRVTALTASFVFTAAASAIAALGPDALRSGPDAIRGTLTTVLIVPGLVGVIPWAVAFRRHSRETSLSCAREVQGRTAAVGQQMS